MTELFDIEPSLSPRLRWIERHRVTTHYSDCGDFAWAAVQLHPDHVGMNVCLLLLDHALYYELGGLVGYGATEEEAITSFAKNMNLRLWNETPAP